MQLSGPQREKFLTALLDAFPTQRKLAMMLDIRLEKDLDAIAFGEDVTDIARTLISTAETEGWIAPLLHAARESNSGNAKLIALAAQLEIAPINTPKESELERIIQETNSVLGIYQWRSRLGMIESSICRIEIPESQQNCDCKKDATCGTGFLLGPDLLMTSYRVMQDVIEGRRASSDVALRFDYKCLQDGTILNKGTVYRLAPNWLIDSSPPAPGEEQEPSPKHLDYALLRVDGKPGYATIGEKDDPESSQRDWLDIPHNDYTFAQNSPLFIMHHSYDESLKLAFNTNAVIGLNANGTRVRYHVNSHCGSSGSPCFDSNWNLVALHHQRDSDTSSEYSEGTPFQAILQLLVERELTWMFGPE